MTLRIALLLLATWAGTRLTGPASDLVHTLLLVGLLLLLVGVLKARDAAGPTIVSQFLEVPALDLTLGSPSIKENATGYGLTAADLPRVLGYYLAEPHDARHPYASPLLADDLSGLPPAHIWSAEFDPLRDDGSRYAERLREAGVPATFSLQEGHIHISSALTAILPAARAWRDEVLEALKALHRSTDRT